MPLLAKRKSLLDLLTSNDQRGQQQQQRSKDSSLAPTSTVPARPVSDHGVRQPSRLSHELFPNARPQSPPVQEENARTKRFSLLKMRNHSEPELRYRARQHAVQEEVPPMPQPRPASSANVGTPAIIKTAPTMEHSNVEHEGDAERKPRRIHFGRQASQHKKGEASPGRSAEQTQSKPSALKWRKLQGRSTTGLEDLHRHSMAMAGSAQPHAPPAYGDERQSSLALPANRISDSSDADGSNRSSGDQIYGATTTTHTVSTHTTFFKLPRRNKNRNSLFPLPVKLPPPGENRMPHSPTTPRASTSAVSATSRGSPDARSPPPTAMQRRHTEASPTATGGAPFPLPSPSAMLGRGSLSFAEPGLNMFRSDSQRSRGSGASSPLQPPMRLGMRDRASTASSFGRPSVDTPPPMTGSGRTSTSTTGRSSLGGFLSFARFRQGSDPHSPRHGSPGRNSKSNSFAMSREALVIPEREEGDTPGKYLERLEASISRSLIAGILSKSADAFAQNVLRSYTRRFPFFGEPIDMSLRKFLLEAELPKETQQVDRVMEAFAFRYHECNPGIFPSPDQAYVIAFSLMMLHTDAFNKNNKHKMQRADYIKNTRGQDVAEEVLACFYDNICYTPFVHYEEEVDINGERILPFKPKKSKLKGAVTDGTIKKPTGPVDPYNLLVEQKLEMLRPAIRDTITMEDPYSYLVPATKLDMPYLQRAFTHTGTLQIISARSRPAAYEAQLNNQFPSQADTQAGIVDLKVSKVGILWRKSTKRKKTRSPWQEWGAILTGSQLYLFKNAHWVKGLQHQFKQHQKPNQPRQPVVFKPPLHEFKPDNLIKTDNAVALVDHTYNRHKHAFTFVRPGNEEEVLLADDEAELNDWLALINYAAAFRAAGVRVRGMVGGNEEEQQSARRLEVDANHTVHTVDSATGPVIVKNRGLSEGMQRQVMTARRQIMAQKINESEHEIEVENRRLESMLRNARHLQLLAPIAPRTREQVLMAAAQTDAVIKWTRRGIWRTKCHKDILSLDVEQDGVSAVELAASSPPPTDAATSQARVAQRLPSKTSTTKSPPQSPTSHIHRASHSVSTTSTSTFAEAEAFKDVFRTPSETHTTVNSHQRMESQAQNQTWHLPPLQLDVTGPSQPQSPSQSMTADHRPSIASTTGTYLTSPSAGGRPSFSQASSRSSLRTPSGRSGVRTSSEVSESRHASPGISDTELRILANNGLTPSQVSPNLGSMDGAVNNSATPTPTGTPAATAPTPSTPETKRKSAHRNSARRSLQKTLRDSTHSHRDKDRSAKDRSSIHRHRRDKDSQSTVRSNDTVTGDLEGLEATPGLERAKGRFILHGKQASVVQFSGSGEWDKPDERMRKRREAWKEGGMGSPKAVEGRERGKLGSQDSNAFSFGKMRSVSGESGSTATGIETARSVDAITSSPREGKGYFDIPAWRSQQHQDQQGGKRETVIKAPTPAKSHELLSSSPTLRHARRDEVERPQTSPTTSRHKNSLRTPSTPTRKSGKRTTAVFSPVSPKSAASPYSPDSATDPRSPPGSGPAIWVNGAAAAAAASSPRSPASPRTVSTSSSSSFVDVPSRPSTSMRIYSDSEVEALDTPRRTAAAAAAANLAAAADDNRGFGLRAGGGGHPDMSPMSSAAASTHQPVSSVSSLSASAAEDEEAGASSDGNGDGDGDGDGDSLVSNPIDDAELRRLAGQTSGAISPAIEGQQQEHRRGSSGVGVWA